jgi:hypothetical protein
VTLAAGFPPDTSVVVGLSSSVLEPEPDADPSVEDAESSSSSVPSVPVDSLASPALVSFASPSSVSDAPSFEAPEETSGSEVALPAGSPVTVSPVSVSRSSSFEAD